MSAIGERRLQLFVLAVGLSLVITSSVLWAISGDVSDVNYWRTLGYPGVFFLSFLGSVALVLPVPGLIAVCGAGGLALNPIFIGLLSGTGETIGEVSGYAIGFGGRTVIERRAFYHRVRNWMEQRGSLVIFLVSVIPNPLVDIVGIAAGGLRYPIIKFFIIVLVGKSIKGLIVVNTCSWIADYISWG